MTPNHNFPADVLIAAIRDALSNGQSFVGRVASMSHDDFDASFERTFIIPTRIRRNGVDVLVGPELKSERDAKPVVARRAEP